MGGDLGRRIAKLEQETLVTLRAYAWRDPGQTADEAVAARYPEGVPPGVDVSMIGWLESAD
jgi:hypothetical protein